MIRSLMENKGANRQICDPLQESKRKTVLNLHIHYKTHSNFRNVQHVKAENVGKWVKIEKI